MLIVVARCASIVNWIIDNINITYMTSRLLLVKKQQARMKRVRAKRAPIIVQIQSVNFR